jgi:twinkle protein
MDFSEQAKNELRQWGRTKSPGQYRRTCPDCSPGRTKKREECLSASVTSEKVLANCRHCGASGRVNLEEKIIPFRPHAGPSYSHVPSAPHTAPSASNKAVKDIRPTLDAVARLWLKGRAISDSTAERYGVIAARAWFRDLNREGPAIAFPYHVNGGVAGHKVRSTEAKDHVCDKGLYSLFGIQLVDLDKESQIIVCEGEADCLAVAEAGIPNPVSVPNGASSFGTFQESEDPKAQYGFLWSAKEKIDAAKRIYIATDMDEPGEKLAEELARRIGKHRCWRVKFPDGCKDANDTLLKHGKDAVIKAIKDAEPWPIDGLYEADQFFENVLDLFHNGFDDRVLTGLTPVDDLYSIGKGLLTVVTGIPGNGKSTFVDQLMVNASRRYGYIHAVCSFENPVDVHIGKLAQVLVQKHFFKTDLPGATMNEEELRNALGFIHKHFKFMHQDDGKKATIESIIERIKTAVFRWGVRGVVVDPYNYISRPRSAESETQFIDDILTELRLVAKLYGLHIWFIAHPTKMQMDAEGDYQVPKGYSISGSAAWFSKPDFGLTVHRQPNSPGLVKISCWKVRFDWLGRVGDTEVVYDNCRHIYMADAFSDMSPMEPSKGPNSYREARGWLA